MAETVSGNNQLRQELPGPGPENRGWRHSRNVAGYAVEPSHADDGETEALRAFVDDIYRGMGNSALTETESGLPPRAKLGEPSVLEKSVETESGVHVTKTQTRPIRLGASTAPHQPSFDPSRAAAQAILNVALEIVAENRELVRAKQIARRDALLGQLAEIQAEIAKLDAELE